MNSSFNLAPINFMLFFYHLIWQRYNRSLSAKVKLSAQGSVGHLENDKKLNSKIRLFDGFSDRWVLNSY